MAEYTVSLKADVSQIKKGVESVGDSLKGLQKAAGNLSNLLGIGLAIKGFDMLAGAMAAPIAEAQNAAKQVESLNLALALSGQLSEENTKAFEGLANSLETTSVFSGEAVLGAAKLAINLGATADQAKSLVKAAADLSAATGVDLDTATQALTKSLQGQGAQLGKLVPQLKGMKEEALRAGEGLSFVATRFQGAAEAAGNTFSGSLQQSKEAFGNLLEEIGNFIVQNPVVVFLLKTVTSLFNDLTAYIKANQSSIMTLVQNGIVFLIDAFSVFVSIVQKGVLPLLRTVIVGFAGLSDAMTFVGNIVGTVLDPVINHTVKILAEMVSMILKLISTLSKIPAVSKGLESLGINSEKLTAGLESASEAAKDFKKSFDVKGIRNSVNEAIQGAAETSELGLIGAENYLGAFNSKVKTFGKKAGSLIGTEIATGLKNQPPAEVPVTVDPAKIKAAFDEAVKNPVGAVFEIAGIKLANDFASESQAQMTGIFQGLTGAVTKGAEGARGLVVQTLTAGATALLGPFGQALGPIFDLLSQGPEKVKQTIDAFTSALPAIISNIVLAIPVLIQSINESIPLIIDNLIANLPMMIDALIASLPQIIMSAVTLMPRITTAFTFGLIKAIPQIINAFIAEIPTMISSFTMELVNAAGDFINAIWQWIKDTIPGAGAAGKAATGDFGGAISDTLSGIGDFFGFAEGGMVPAGYPNDSFPAKLTSGEAVLPTDTVAKLESFLANGGGGAGQNVTINLVVGEEQLAKVMLNLNRQGFRTS
jgi:hypothetical protein